jgi:hypothetical protein
MRDGSSRRTHWVTTFQKDKSYRLSWNETVVLAPGARKTESNPRSWYSGELLDAGGEMYSYNMLSHVVSADTEV